jgi:hypothetical protein
LQVANISVYTIEKDVDFSQSLDVRSSNRRLCLEYINN